VALEISPRVVSTCRKHSRGGWKWFRFLGCWGRAGERGTGGGGSTRGLVSIWASWRLARGSSLIPMFHFDGNRVYVLRFATAKKKQRSFALDTRFGRNNAAAKRPGMKNCFLSETRGEFYVCSADIILEIQLSNSHLVNISSQPCEISQSIWSWFFLAKIILYISQILI